MTHARLPLGNFSRAHRVLPVAVAIAMLMAASAQATGYNWSTGPYSSTGLPPTYLAADVLNISGGGYSGALINSGILRKSAGMGATTFSNIGFTNNGGVIDAQSGSINFSSGTFNFNNGTQFTGAGQSILSGNASFAGSLVTSNLTISASNFTGTASVVSGTLNWSGSRLQGDWQLAAGQSMNVQGGGYKYLNGSLTNNGTVAATDTLYLLGNNSLANQGLYELQGDVSLVDGGYGGNFVNTGAFRKSAGTGTTDVSGIGFVNNGTVQVASGNIQLPANFSNAGTLKGSGSVSTNLLTNTGHVAPGNSPGTLSLTGNFAQTAPTQRASTRRTRRVPQAVEIEQLGHAAETHWPATPRVGTARA